jgi:hypothetical protein
VRSLLATCRLRGIDPYDYFANVPQRVGRHPACLVHPLTTALESDVCRESATLGPA